MMLPKEGDVQRWATRGRAARLKPASPSRERSDEPRVAPSVRAAPRAPARAFRGAARRGAADVAALRLGEICAQHAALPDEPVSSLESAWAATRRAACATPTPALLLLGRHVRADGTMSGEKAASPWTPEDHALMGEALAEVRFEDGQLCRDRARTS